MYNYGNSSWTDLLTSYNGQNITYDAIGNPTSYLGYTLKWNGRQLSSLSGNGTTASYKYDADGLRSYKKVNGVETTYQYVGDKLMYEKRGATEFYYYYNSFGNLAGIKYVQNGTEYMVYAICNMRGDVEDLYWGSGNLACHYTYDTWGNVISVTDINGKEITNANHIGLMNPIRYRGYYYDSEIGMYYLQSRYYNPQVGRFLNADGYVSTGQDVTGYNMFAYCGNNPVNRMDSYGEFWTSIKTLFNNVINAFKKTVQSIMNSNTNSQILPCAEHHKKGTTNEHNRNKHERGQARKNRDNHGEKGDARRKPNPNKRRSQNIEPSVSFGEKIVCSVIVIVVVVGIVYLVVNDASIIGVLDDSLIGVLVPIAWENASKVVT